MSLKPTPIGPVPELTATGATDDLRRSGGAGENGQHADGREAGEGMPPVDLRPCSSPQARFEQSSWFKRLGQRAPKKTVARVKKARPETWESRGKTMRRQTAESRLSLRSPLIVSERADS